VTCSSTSAWASTADCRHGALHMGRAFLGTTAQPLEQHDGRASSPFRFRLQSPPASLLMYPAASRAHPSTSTTWRRRTHGNTIYGIAKGRDDKLTAGRARSPSLAADGITVPVASIPAGEKPRRGSLRRAGAGFDLSNSGEPGVHRPSVRSRRSAVRILACLDRAGRGRRAAAAETVLGVDDD